jgi:hypothetical protein
MKFSTFAWFNTLLICCVLLFGSLNRHDLNLICTNTDVERSLLLNGRLVYSDGQLDTFATAIKIVGNKSLQLSYPASQPQVSYNFEIVEFGEQFIAAQVNSKKGLLTLAIARKAGKWEGQLIELTYGDKASLSMLLKGYYCRRETSNSMSTNQAKITIVWV